ncbi:MAG: DUF6091 family protein [Polaromonas sp.]|nr:DUF6091 family protein [Polaromonas sp.]
MAFFKKYCAVAVLIGSSAVAVAAPPLPQVKMCVFDPQGASGDAFRAARDFRYEMLEEGGVDIDAKSYVDERVAAEDFRTGQCDALMASGLRTKAFNAMAASLDSVGASTIIRNGKVDLAASYDVVRKFIQLVSLPKAADMMVDGAYEIAGILPIGAAYVFVSNKEFASIEGQTAKRFGTFDLDKAEAHMVERIGARPVSVDFSNVAAMFNNHNVDMVVLPTIVYMPFELYRGLGTKGAVIRMPMTIATYQTVIRPAKFPKGFGQKARTYMARNFELYMASLKLADKDVPENMWVDFSTRDTERYAVLLRQGRVLMAEKGFYDKKGLKLIKKIRCSINPAASECSEQTEEW